MKTLRNNIYKDIASILCCMNSDFRTSQNVVLFSRVLSTYPSKSIYCLVSNRVTSFIEKNIFNTSLMVEIMKEEGEDEEIIENIEFLIKNPTIKTKSECSRLCQLLADYVKFARILKIKDSFIKTLDIIDNDDDAGSLHNNIEQLNKCAIEITSAYNAVNVSDVSHAFDSDDTDATKMAIAEAKDIRSPDKCIITGIRGLNSLLSPGYLAG